MYEVKTELRPSGLRGISEEQIAQHWQVYEGYVAQVDMLREELAFLRREGLSGNLIFADRRRRFGYEFNGMLLHEYYFDNLRANVLIPAETSPLRNAIDAQFGSFDAFRSDLMATGSTRSVGWAVLYLDPETQTLDNHFVRLHQDGNVAGFVPLLVMDVWEHAYMVDRPVSGRLDYIFAFLNNVDWHVVEQRFDRAMTGDRSRQGASRAAESEQRTTGVDA